MIGIKMKPNIPVHYQKGVHITEGYPPTPNIQPPPAASPPNLLIFFILYFYFICTKIVLQEKIMPSDYIYQSCKHICLYDHHSSGTDPGFQVRWGAHLKKLRRVEGCAKIFGVFRVKNHDFTPKNHLDPPL